MLSVSEQEFLRDTLHAMRAIEEEMYVGLTGPRRALLGRLRFKRLQLWNLVSERVATGDEAFEDEHDYEDVQSFPDPDIWGAVFDDECICQSEIASNDHEKTRQ